MKPRCHLNIRPADETAWFPGGFQLRVSHPTAFWNRSHTFSITQPWLLVGRLPTAHLHLDGPDLSPRHLFFYQDEAGLFALDLSTRSGSRIGPLAESAAWLKPGDPIDIPHFRIQFQGPEPPARHPTAIPPRADPLDLDTNPALPAVQIDIPSRAPIQMCSRLLVLGRSPAAGVSLPRAGLSRMHAVLIRHPSGLYVVDLASSGTWLHDQPVHACARFHAPSSTLRLGRLQLIIHIKHPSSSRALAPVARPSAPPLATTTPRTFLPAPTRPELAPPQPPAQLDPAHLSPQLAAILAELIAAIQTSHNELLQRQDSLRQDLLHQIESLRTEVASGHASQARAHEQLRSELQRLRDDIRKRFSAPPSFAHRPATQPNVKLPPLQVPPPPDPAISQEEAVAWLLERFQNKLDPRDP